MNINGERIRLTPEHRAFVKDLTSVIISYTPVSGVVDTIKFSHKWFGKRRLVPRITGYMKKRNRKSYIKSRSRRLNNKYKRHKDTT